jgi:hypothetical protein
LHDKYSKDGLVCLSVSLDDPREKGKLAKVQKFLEASKADFTNVVLDEDQEFWQKKFNFLGPPCVYVFNQEGKWVRFVADDDRNKNDQDEDHYKKVEKLVVEWLKQGKVANERR